MPLDILYEDGPVLVVNKPPGLLTQAPRGIDSLELWVRAYWKEKEQIEGNLYCGIVHRIDRPVTGAIVFGRHVRATRRLAKQFEERTVGKTYWALVEGRVEPDEGTWRDHLHKRHGMAQAIVVPEDDPRGKHAVLHYAVRERLEHATWLEITLENGPHSPDPRPKPPAAATRCSATRSTARPRPSAIKPSTSATAKSPCTPAASPSATRCATRAWRWRRRSGRLGRHFHMGAERLPSTNLANRDSLVGVEVTPAIRRYSRGEARRDS